MKRPELGRPQSGQTMTEYVAVLGIISLGVIFALTVFGGQISSAITTLAGRI